MSLNVSSSNDSLLHPNLSSVNTNSLMGCLVTPPSSFIFAAFNLTKILLLLPLCFLVLYLGLKRRSSTSAAATSHSDVFTYNMVAMELSGLAGSIMCWGGRYEEGLSVVFVGHGLISLSWHGETLFHLLMCLERYLAVVHPVTYRSLRGERGVRVRNVGIGCVWLICCAGTSVLRLKHGVYLSIDVVFLIFGLIVISFCSLSVICVLIRPGPGEQRGDRERVDQSRRRASYTITAILGVLLLKCVATLLWLVAYVISGRFVCSLLVAGVSLQTPSSLVSPLLFLHRAGIPACSRPKN